MAFQSQGPSAFQFPLQGMGELQQLSPQDLARIPGQLSPQASGGLPPFASGGLQHLPQQDLRRIPQFQPQDPGGVQHLPPQLLNLLGQQPSNPFGGIPSAPGTQAEHFDVLGTGGGDPASATAAIDTPLAMQGLLPPPEGLAVGNTPNFQSGQGQQGGFDIMSLLGLFGQGSQQQFGNQFGSSFLGGGQRGQFSNFF